MAPVTELVRLTPKEGQEADFVAALAEGTSTILQQPGVKGVHTSPVVEKDNPNYLLLVDWDSIDSHKAFKSKSDVFGPFVQKLGAVVAAPPTVYHVAFSPEHPPVLRNAEGKGGAKTAVVELVHAYFPTGDAFTTDLLAATAKNVQTFLELVSSHAPAGFTGQTAAGWAAEEIEFKGEKARVFVTAIGWDSVEAHLKYRETEHFTKSIPLVRGLEKLKGLEVFHISTKSW